MRTMQLVVALVVVLGFHGICQASEPAHGTERHHNDEAAILRAVQGFAIGSITGDVEGLMGLWDARVADEVSFTQVENEFPVIGLENFRSYYEGFVANFIVLRGDVSDVQIRRYGDMAYVVCRYNWVVREITGGAELHQPTRATIVLRKQGHRWLYLHFHESITYPVPET